MMIKWGPDAPHMVLTFSCSDGDESIQIFDGRIKTPSAGFLPTPPEAETLLVSDLQGLFAPAERRRLLKAPGFEWHLPGYSVTYLGKSLDDKALATLSFAVERYLIETKDRTEKLVVTSGQLPPQPATFSLGLLRSGTLYTYESPGGERLMPDVFWVQ
ncbi:MAG: hypothetical protein ACO3JL_11900 [Myxococcota bacterium]